MRNQITEKRTLLLFWPIIIKPQILKKWITGLQQLFIFLLFFFLFSVRSASFSSPFSSYWCFKRAVKNTNMKIEPSFNLFFKTTDCTFCMTLYCVLLHLEFTLIDIEKRNSWILVLAFLTGVSIVRVFRRFTDLCCCEMYMYKRLMYKPQFTVYVTAAFNMKNKKY